MVNYSIICEDEEVRFEKSKENEKINNHEKENNIERKKEKRKI